MKVRAIQYPEYQIKTSNMPTKNTSNIGFEGLSTAKKNGMVDWVLKNKYAQKLFGIADKNPHVLNVICIGVLGTTLRPATLLAVPGAEKEDKQYVAAKSIIGTILFVASQLLISLPLGKGLKELGKTAVKNPQSKFYKYSPKKMEAYSFLISNAVGLVLSLFSSSFLTVKLTTKIMNKLFSQRHAKQSNDTQNPQGKERVL